MRSAAARAAGCAAGALLLAASLARAGDLTSTPISHASGFDAVTCHLVNGHPTKDLIVEEFFIEDVNTSTAFGSSASGACSGLPPWTLPPRRGCGRDLIVVSACDPPNACFCWARFKGSPKTVRGRIIGTVTGTSTTVSADLE
jgi:hypothetical protein